VGSNTRVRFSVRRNPPTGREVMERPIDDLTSEIQVEEFFNEELQPIDFSSLHVEDFPQPPASFFPISILEIIPQEQIMRFSI
jgi:hypothetical protein